jgi:hypothetical protein
MQKLSPLDEILYKHLRRELDRCQDARYARDRHPNVEQDYFRAKKELTKFVAEKRKEGINI